MDLNLDQLVVRFQVTPSLRTCNGREWEDYKVEGFINGLYVGYVRVTRTLTYKEEDRNGYFFDLSHHPPTPKPYIGFQRTETEFKGHGICGRLIVAANDFYSKLLGANLWSDTLFVKPEAKRVWAKLQKQGLAAYTPHQNLSGNKLDRWVMI